jgi:subtilisin family serine protease
VDWRLVLGFLLLLLVLLLLLLRQPQEARYYVEDQVLLSGPAEEITRVVGSVERELEAEGVRLVRLETLELAFLKRVPGDCEGLPFDPAAENYVIARYGFSGGKLGVEEVVRRLLDAAGDGPVRPEPNYLTSSPWSIGGSPWSIGGSPWSIGGSPWSIGGSPWSIGGSPAGSEVAAAANRAFREQWAFGDRGIHLAGTSPNRPKGQGVLVGIFDTSPFPVTMAHALLAADPPLRIELQHELPGGPFVHADKLPDIRDHGLFAAGLVHALAPASDIRQVRVLDNAGQGDLQTLNRALNAFIDDVASRRKPAGSQEEPPLRGAVINLSLGVHPPPNAAEQGLPAEISSLQIILAAAQCMDIVTVAAAGNDSAGAPAPRPAQIPASWPSTIGVAASNDRGELACFSNKGDILAPGGEGGPNRSQCRPMFDRCSGDCPYALISLSLASPTGYRYWTGTSFSTPIVSGLAAAVIDGDGGWLPLAVVRNRLAAGGHPLSAPYPGIVVDVAGTTP